MNSLLHTIRFCTQIAKSSSLRLYQKRFLYAPATMGVDAYVQTRERTLAQFSSTDQKFKAKMVEFADPDSKHMVFTEDLKSMVHLVEDKEEDLQTFLAMLAKFNKQNKELRFGSFIFGPVIMRMFYYLGKPKEALAAFKNSDFTGVFDQLITYQILMDLLFTTGHYNEVLEVFEIIKNKQLQPNRYPKNVVVLFLAACYKLNSPESFSLAADIWKELKQCGHNPMRRAITFAAALALNQGAPHVALEMLSNEKQQNYITVRNLKTMALSDLGRPDDVLPLLRSVLNTDDPTGQKHTFTQDTMEKVALAMGRCTDKDIVAEYQRIEKQLHTYNLIINHSLDSVLCKEITAVIRNDQNQRSQLLAGSYNRRTPYGGGSGGGNRPRYQRPGLSDMV